MHHSLQFLLLFVMILSVALQVTAVDGRREASEFSATNSFGGRWDGAIPSDNPEVVAWLGIEYGKAKRFDLSTVVKHTGVQEANTYGPCCLQSAAFLEGQYNSTVAEDCLFLNVFAPRISFGSGKRLPVVIYMHGGAFTFGSGSTRFLNPERYTQHDVILVSINYRLNLLGFLTLPNLPYTNFGLYDQRVAMEWVHENIEAFGGDASRVTLIGDSAGGISILHHLTSTLHQQKPLFHRAIVISAGLFAGPELTIDKAQKQYLKIAASLGCPLVPGHPNSALDCLLAKPVSGVRVVTKRFPTPFISTYPMALRETGAPINDRTFFPDLIESLATGKYDRSIPVIIGSDLDEGSMFAAAAFPIVFPDEALFSSIVNKLFGDKAPVVMERYGPHATGSARKSMNDLTSHLFTAHGTCQAARLMSQFSTAPIYRYGNYHIFRHPSNPLMGVFHTAAHAVFLRPAQPGLIFPQQYDDEELAMSAHFGRLLMEFAHGKTFSPEEWPTFDHKGLHELHIGPNNSSRLVVGSGFQKADCDFWTSLYPPHGLLPPMYHGNLYEHEPFWAWVANEGFWIAAANIRLIKSGSLLILVSILLLLLYRCSPYRKRVNTPQKKVKKD
jgi:carboxylesterase type B